MLGFPPDATRAALHNFNVLSSPSLSQVTALGFPPDAARAALHNFNANIETAVEELLKCGGMIPIEWAQAVMAATNGHSGSTSSTDGSGQNSNPANIYYCRTGNFHDRKISRIRGVGRFATGKYREFLNCTGPGLSNGGFGLKIGAFSSDLEPFYHPNPSYMNDYEPLTSLEMAHVHVMFAIHVTDV